MCPRAPVAALLLAALLSGSGPGPAAAQPAPPADGALERLWGRGDEAFARGELDAAFAAYSEALALDEGRARSWNCVGGVHFARGAYGRALEAFRRAVELDPGDVRALNNAGSAAERLGGYGDAEGFYLRAVLADPAYPVSHRNLGVLYAYRLGRPREARRSWLRYLELVPAGPAADAVRVELERLPATLPGAPAEAAPEVR